MGSGSTLATTAIELCQIGKLIVPILSDMETK